MTRTPQRTPPRTPPHPPPHLPPRAPQEHGMKPNLLPPLPHSTARPGDRRRVSPARPRPSRDSDRQRGVGGAAAGVRAGSPGRGRARPCAPVLRRASGAPRHQRCGGTAQAAVTRTCRRLGHRLGLLPHAAGLELVSVGPEQVRPSTCGGCCRLVPGPPLNPSLPPCSLAIQPAAPQKTRASDSESRPASGTPHPSLALRLAAAAASLNPTIQSLEIGRYGARRLGRIDGRDGKRGGRYFPGK